MGGKNVGRKSLFVPKSKRGSPKNFSQNILFLLHLGKNAEQHLNSGCFACAIRPQKTQNLPFAQGKRNVIYCSEFTKVLC